MARALAKTVVNAPLTKCAMAGNDPNVGRIVQAVGKYLGTQAAGLDVSRMRIALGGHTIFADGSFRLDHNAEKALTAHLKEAELYASAPPDGGVFRPAVNFPPHEGCVKLDIDLAAGSASATVLGADLTHEYVSENADYRS